MLDIREHNDGILFPLLVQPRSKKNEILGIHDGALRIKVVALPVEGAANEACRKILSEALGVSKSNIEIIKGKTSSRKMVKCRKVNPKKLQAWLNHLNFIDC
ncbi:MAG: DUF167 domain-containing protein [Pseudomonadota bacterium]